jgi:hypothetical protein
MGRFSCVECGAISDRNAVDWIAAIAGGFDQGPLQTLVFCPACAARECLTPSPVTKAREHSRRG